jgi:hypothetical protein
MEPNDRQFQMRVSKSFLETLDNWRRQQPDLPARAEAIRRLVEIGLAVPKAIAEFDKVVSKLSMENQHSIYPPIDNLRKKLG